MRITSVVRCHSRSHSGRPRLLDQLLLTVAAAPPAEDDMPAMATGKRIQRLRKFQAQAAELNAVRDELHLGGWDGCVICLSVLQGSGPKRGRNTDGLVTVSSWRPSSRHNRSSHA